MNFQPMSPKTKETTKKPTPKKTVTPKKQAATKSTPPVKQKKPKKSGRDAITRAQAIKLMCIECMGFQKSLVKNCSDAACPLWPYRTGTGQEHTEVKVRQ